MSETSDGDVVIKYKGTALPARPFVKESRVTQGAIADSKVLGPMLADIQRRQQERDAQTLAGKRLTLREEDLMQKSMGEAGLPTRRAPGRPTLRQKALERMASSGIEESQTSVVDQLVSQAVRRLHGARSLEVDV